MFNFNAISRPGQSWSPTRPRRLKMSMGDHKYSPTWQVKKCNPISTVLAFCREVNVCPTNLSSAISRPELHFDIIDQSVELIIERSDLCCS